MNRFARIGLGMLVILIYSCGIGCKRNRESQRETKPAYFHSMDEGLRYERRSDYKHAISTYYNALSETDGVNADLRTKANIAVHNRIAACYRSMGNKEMAASEFRISLSLGDTKYAPKALSKLK